MLYNEIFVMLCIYINNKECNVILVIITDYNTYLLYNINIENKLGTQLFSEVN
ncbi:22189_t:CDS:2 [Gigaspora rosea]|nr:22189_t:CDS:2 [Gigaspora rosea]